MQRQRDDSGSDLYLLGRRIDRNVKIRDDRLDLKALRESKGKGKLERWEPVWCGYGSRARLRS